MNARRVFLSLLFVQFAVVILGQQRLIPLNREASFETESKLFQSDSNFHTSIKPYTLSDVNRAGINLKEIESSFFLDKYHANFTKNEFVEKKKGFFISPLISGSGQLQIQDKSVVLPEYSAGVYMESYLGKKLSLCATYRYLGENLPDYLDTSVFNQEIIPSVARVNSSQGEINMANQLEGYLSYEPNRFFSFLLGKGRNFWGEGYRSLLLSDNATAYPYLRINSTFWNVKYVNLYSWHNDFTIGENRNKFSSSHILSWNIIPEINIGVFETVIWQGSDTLNNRGFDVAYLNPAIFYRPVEYSQGSSDNSIMGLSIKFRLKKKHIVYGQVVLDEFLLSEIKSRSKWWANKQGGQIGYKVYDAFNVENLSFQTELNIVRPFTYTHLTSFQNYGHNNQSLVHPVGASFWETVSFARYKKDRFYFEEEISFIQTGSDTSSISYGGDMFQSYTSRDGDYGHKIAQGVKHSILYNKLKVSYLLVNATNLRAFAQYVLRVDQTENKSIITNFIQIGISSRLWNEYRDY